jgi:hypothetical protein
MYGMINNALQQMMNHHYGDTQWGRSSWNQESADGFVSMHSYPDQLTYDMVGHAAHVISVPATEILEQGGYRNHSYCSGGVWRYPQYGR